MVNMPHLLKSACSGASGPQLESPCVATKTPHAATKTGCSPNK